jgi:hypothetical protein
MTDATASMIAVEDAMEKADEVVAGSSPTSSAAWQLQVECMQNHC